MARHQKKLGEILVEWGIINAKELQKAVDHAKAKNMRIGEALVDLKLASETQVYKALASQHSMEYVELEKGGIPPEAVNQIPDDIMRKYLVLPMGKENGRLKVAIHDPPSTGDCGRLESPSLMLMLSSGKPSMSAATCAMMV